MLSKVSFNKVDLITDNFLQQAVEELAIAAVIKREEDAISYLSINWKNNKPGFWTRLALFFVSKKCIKTNEAIMHYKNFRGVMYITDFKLL